MLLLLTALWTLWGACWLRRVELRHEKEPLVRALGLAWGREGLGPAVVARGMLAGRPVEVRWRRGVFGDRARLRTNGARRWRTLASDEELYRLSGEPPPDPS
ncbi:MAG: hypothetical protein Q8P41_08895 [Pseudomonadota bacterium]|nr:hypothetical protein [Pseudomonadota bacterium]